MISHIVFLLMTRAMLISADLNNCKFLKDIMIILDGSASISKPDFELAKEAVVQMIKPVVFSNETNRIAFMVFGDFADLKFNLDAYFENDVIIEQIKLATNLYSNTGIGKAINRTFVEVLPKMRKNAEKLVFLFTDGSNNLYPAPFIYAKKLKDAGVKIVTLGIGGDINRKELKQIASEGLSIEVDSFQSLQINIKKILDTMCPIIDTRPMETCSIEQQDLVFVIDTSESINNEDFAFAKDFAKTISMKGPIGPSATRVSLVTFSDSVRVNFNLDNGLRVGALMNEISNAEKFGYTTGIGAALAEVRNNVLPRRRKGVPFNVILLTDGVNNMYPNPQQVVPGLKKEGANIVTVGISHKINMQELNAISSNGKSLTVENYEQLKNPSFIESVYTDFLCKNN